MKMLGRILTILLVAFGAIGIVVWLGSSIEKGKESCLSNGIKTDSANKDGQTLASKLRSNSEEVQPEETKAVSLAGAPKASNKSLVKDQTLASKLRHKALKETGERASFDRALAEGVEKSSINLRLACDSSQTKELSAANIKWLIYETWGDYFQPLCEYLKLPTDTIVDMWTHESGGNPWAVNPISKATGGGQFLLSTAKTMAKKYDIPLEVLDRKDPYQNMLMTCLYFRENMDYFRNKQSPETWAIAAHYCGAGAVEDSVSHYRGDPSNFWFTKIIVSIAKVKPKEAPEWAKSIWKNSQWALLSVMQKRHEKNHAVSTRKKLSQATAVASGYN